MGSLAVATMLFFFAASGFCQDGKATMEQWLKIINSKGDKSPPPDKAAEIKNTRDDVNRPASAASPATSGIPVTVY